MSSFPSRSPSFLVLVNPSSGGGRGRSVIAELERLFQNNQFSGSVEPINFIHLSQQLKSLRERDCLLIAGGDGTISQVVSKAKEFSKPIGILPLGTGNDLARELGIPPVADISKLEEIIRHFDLKRYINLTTWEVLFLDKQYTMLNYLSIGFDASVAYRFNQTRNVGILTLLQSSTWGRRLLYLLVSIVTVKEKVAVDLVLLLNEKLVALPAHTSSLILANIRSYMGIGNSNEYGDPEDSQLEIMACRSLLSHAAMISPHFSGFSPKLVGTGEYITFSSETKSLFLQIDGEPFHLSPQTKVNVAHSSSIKLLYCL
jgi:diacylglycerol kinase family enzyme